MQVVPGFRLGQPTLSCPWTQTSPAMVFGTVFEWKRALGAQATGVFLRVVAAVPASAPAWRDRHPSPERQRRDSGPLGETGNECRIIGSRFKTGSAWRTGSASPRSPPTGVGGFYADKPATASRGGRTVPLSVTVRGRSFGRFAQVTRRVPPPSRSRRPCRCQRWGACR